MTGWIIAAAFFAFVFGEFGAQEKVRLSASPAERRARLCIGLASHSR